MTSKPQSAGLISGLPEAVFRVHIEENKYVAVMPPTHVNVERGWIFQNVVLFRPW